MSPSSPLNLPPFWAYATPSCNPIRSEAGKVAAKPTDILVRDSERHTMPSGGSAVMVVRFRPPVSDSVVCAKTGEAVARMNRTTGRTSDGRFIGKPPDVCCERDYGLATIRSG